jgi:Flp pilus assembly protein TadG
MKVAMRLRQRDRGQTLVLVAVAMIALVGLLAFVVDAGMFWEVRRDFQSAADAAALAGVGQLPNSSAAISLAQSYADINAPAARALCAQSPTSSNGGVVAVVGWDSASSVYTLTVTISCPTGYSFGRILNISSPMTISASATAALGSVAAADCPFPMLIEEDYPNAYQYADSSGNSLTSIDSAVTVFGYGFGATDYDGDGQPGYTFSLESGNAVPLTSTTSVYAQTASDTVITPNKTNGFPPYLPFTIQERQSGETMVVTAVTATTWTVRRGAAGTTAQAIKAGDNLDYDADFGLICLGAGGCGASSSGGTPGFADWLAQNPCAALSAGSQTLQTPGGGGAQGAILGTSGNAGWSYRPPSNPAYQVSNSIATCTQPPTFGSDGVTVLVGSPCIGAFPIVRTNNLLNVNGSKPVDVLSFAPFYVQAYNAQKSTTTISGQFVKVKYSATLGAYSPNSTPFTQLIR